MSEGDVRDTRPGTAGPEGTDAGPRRGESQDTDGHEAADTRPQDTAADADATAAADPAARDAGEVGAENSEDTTEAVDEGDIDPHSHGTYDGAQDDWGQKDPDRPDHRDRPDRPDRRDRPDRPDESGASDKADPSDAERAADAERSDSGPPHALEKPAGPGPADTPENSDDERSLPAGSRRPPGPGPEAEHPSEPEAGRAEPPTDQSPGAANRTGSDPELPRQDRAGEPKPAAPEPAGPGAPAREAPAPDGTAAAPHEQSLPADRGEGRSDTRTTGHHDAPAVLRSEPPGTSEGPAAPDHQAGRQPPAEPAHPDRPDDRPAGRSSTDPAASAGDGVSRPMDELGESTASVAELAGKVVEMTVDAVVGAAGRLVNKVAEASAEADFNAKADAGADAFGRARTREAAGDTPLNRTRAEGSAPPAEERREEGDPPADAPQWRKELPDEQLRTLYAKKVRQLVFGDDRDRGPEPERAPDGSGSGTDKPVAAFVGGQPGVGKSRAREAVADDIRERTGTEPVRIDGDAFRQFHPDYEEVMERSPQDMPEVTARAAGRWIEMAIDEARTNNRSVIIEGTFRNPDTLVGSSDLFAGEYRRETHVVAEPEEVSRLGTMSRVLVEGRYTPAKAHDDAYANNPVTVQRAFESGNFDRITLSTRSGRIMESTREPGGYSPGAAEFGDRLHEVRTTALGAGKGHEHLKEYRSTMSGFIATNRVDARTAPDLDRITTDAMNVRSGLALTPQERDAFAASVYTGQLHIQFPGATHKEQPPQKG